MAEDLMIGFKFNDREDKMAEDAAVLAASDALFFESRAQLPGADGTKDMNIGVGEMPDDLAEFDFVEAFDFSF